MPSKLLPHAASLGDEGFLQLQPKGRFRTMAARVFGEGSHYGTAQGGGSGLFALAVDRKVETRELLGKVVYVDCPRHVTID